MEERLTPAPGVGLAHGLVNVPSVLKETFERSLCMAHNCELHDRRESGRDTNVQYL